MYRVDLSTMYRETIIYVIRGNRSSIAEVTLRDRERGREVETMPENLLKIRLYLVNMEL